MQYDTRSRLGIQVYTHVCEEDFAQSSDDLYVLIRLCFDQFHPQWDDFYIFLLDQNQSFHSECTMNNCDVTPIVGAKMSA